MISNRYHKTTLGVFAELHLANAAAATGTPDNYDQFVALAAAGSFGVFWVDTKLRVGANSVPLAANAARKFFIAVKDANGISRISTDIPAAGLKLSKTAYVAGAAQVATMTYGGTYSVGQTILVRILDTTPAELPYPVFEYDAVVKSTLAAALSELVAKINAEKVDPVVTASTATTVLTLTAKNPSITFKVTTELFTTTAQPTDASTPVYAETTKAKMPVGDLAHVQELVKYKKIYEGGINYAPEGTLLESFGNPATPYGAVTQWGIIVLTPYKVAEAGSGVRDHTARTNIFLVVPTAILTATAALFEPA